MKRLWRHIIETFQIPYSDIYIAEGSPTLYPIAFRLKLGRKSKLILLSCDALFPDLEAGSWFKKRYFGLVKNQIDAVIAVSEWIGQLAGKYLDVPIRIAKPFISDQLFEQLASLKPNLESHNLISIGVNFGYKGTDILLDAFRIVRDEVSDARLFLIGPPARGTPLINEEGVECIGYTPNIIPFFRNSSLYVQASRGDAFSIAVLEAMRGGLPAIVTEGVGAKEVVKNLHPSFACPINSEELADRILNYFDMSDAQREIYSVKARELSEDFSQTKGLIKFQTVFNDLTSILL